MKRKDTWLFLGMVEEKVVKIVGEFSQKQGPLGESRVDTSLNWAMLGREGHSSQEAQRYKKL